MFSMNGSNSAMMRYVSQFNVTDTLGTVGKSIECQYDDIDGISSMTMGHFSR